MVSPFEGRYLHPAERQRVVVMAAKDTQLADHSGGYGDFQCLFSLKMVDTTCQNIALACSKHQRSLPNSIVGRTYDRTEFSFFSDALRFLYSAVVGGGVGGISMANWLLRMAGALNKNHM